MTTAKTAVKNNKRDLLIEIGTEELPPKALKRLAIAFHDGVQAGLQKSQLGFISKISYEQ